MSIHLNFAILQYNTMKSRDKVMAPTLRDSTIWEYDVLAIHESWHNKHNHSSPLQRPISPGLSGTHRERTNSGLFYINLRLDRADWTVQTHSRDLMTLKIQYNEHNQSKRLCIHNVYREAVRENITATLEQLNSLLEDDHWQHIIMEDFTHITQHGEAWGRRRTHRRNS